MARADPAVPRSARPNRRRARRRARSARRRCSSNARSQRRRPRISRPAASAGLTDNARNPSRPPIHSRGPSASKATAAAPDRDRGGRRAGCAAPTDRRDTGLRRWPRTRRHRGQPPRHSPLPWGARAQAGRDPAAARRFERRSCTGRRRIPVGSGAARCSVPAAASSRSRPASLPIHKPAGAVVSHRVRHGDRISVGRRRTIGRERVGVRVIACDRARVHPSPEPPRRIAEEDLDLPSGSAPTRWASGR